MQVILDKIPVILDALPYILQGSLVTLVTVIGSLTLGLLLGVPFAVLRCTALPLPGGWWDCMSGFSVACPFCFYCFFSISACSNCLD